MDIDSHGEVIKIKRLLEDMADIATIGYIDPSDTDTDSVTCCDDVRASARAYCNVVAARCVVSERPDTNSCVGVTSLVVLKHHRTNSDIGTARCVGLKRLETV